MKVLLRNPRRELEVAGPLQVSVLLQRLEVNRESVLVIRDGTIVPADATLQDRASVEIRPVVSGGSVPRRVGRAGGTVPGEAGRTGGAARAGEDRR